MIATNDFVVHEEETMKGKWHDFFENENPIHIEVGMGKGRFIIDMAKLHPEINYIGIEKYSSVLVRAIEKQTIEQLPNLVFIRMDAEAIENVFEKDEVAYIYLNFSDPWPKDRHARRRLTSVQFLNRYVNFLAAASAEITKAKEQLKGNYILSSESTGARMQGAGRSLLLNKPIYTQEEALKKIDAVNADSVAEIIDRVLDSSTMCISAVGPVNNVDNLFELD